MFPKAMENLELDEEVAAECGVRSFPSHPGVACETSVLVDTGVESKYWLGCWA